MSDPAPPRPHPARNTDLAYELWRLWQQGQRPDVRDFLAAHPDLPLTRCVGVLRVDQQERWLLGERVLAEEYLDTCFFLHGSAEHALDLVYCEFLLRERLGEAPSLGEYAERFPQFAEQLRQQVELHRALGPRSPAEEPADFADRPTVTRDPSGTRGARLPNVPGFEILNLLGRGGMGVVYRARQLKLRRLVALKMVRGADPPDPELLTRFRAESAALARLQHPNIVQVHEVGEHDGRPYLALEYVEGGSLHRQTAATPQPAGPAAQYVQLLARAVHYAHERGIVHRDLKPQNVLLAADGTPKVTDFGLAKLFAVEAGQSSLDCQTHTGAALGTPCYMAPEQTGGGAGPVGPATDVYALGAILYELLTGRPPLQGASVLETLEQVRVQEPVPPRRLQPKVPRDLETITLKCLRKEPSARYPSAEALADDLGRFLGGRPIQARPAGRWERCWKWAKRRPAVAGLALALATAVLALLGLGAWSYLEIRNALDRAENERRAAERNGAEAGRQAEDARGKYKLALLAINKYYLHISENRLLAQPQMEGLRTDLLRDAVGYYQRLLLDGGEDPALRFELARAQFRYAYILDLTGHTGRAFGICARGLALLDGLPAKDAGAEATCFERGHALVLLGRLHGNLNRPGPAESALREAIARFNDLAGRPSAAARYRQGLAKAHEDLAQLYYHTDRVKESVTELQAACAVGAKLVRAHPGNASYRTDLARSQAWLGRMLTAARRFAEAEEPSRRAVDVLRQAARDQPDLLEHQTNLGIALNYRATLHHSVGRLEEARATYEQAREVFERVARAHPTVRLCHINLGATYQGLGAVYVHLRKFDRVRDLYSKGLDLFTKLEAAAPAVPQYSADVAACCFGLATMEHKQHRHEAALKWCELGIPKARLVLAKETRNLYAREQLWRLLQQKGIALGQLNRFAEGLQALERASELADPSQAQELKAFCTEMRAHMGEHARSTAESEAAVAAAGRDPARVTVVLFRAASVYSLGSRSAAKDHGLPAEKRVALADAYQRRAMELLRRARPGLHAHALYLETLRTSPHLDPLRERPDFREFLASLERDAERQK